MQKSWTVSGAFIVIAAELTATTAADAAQLVWGLVTEQRRR
jgi:hypothetical protein